MTGRHADALAVRSWARRLVDYSADRQPMELVADVVASVARSIGGHVPVALAELRPEPDRPLPEPPGGWGDPWLPGAVHEQAVTGRARSARGAWYTPEPVVSGLVGLATADGEVPPFVVDPTCGGGAFLLAALDRCVALGASPADALGRVAGMDIDAGAATVTRWSCQLWAATQGLSIDADRIDVAVGDALVAQPDRWPSRRLVVGNPPFASPLRSGSMPDAAEAFRAAHAVLLGPYSDLAAIHLLANLERCATGSTVALVQPLSLLSSRDTRALRAHCDTTAPLHWVWTAREAVFDAGVRPCAVVVKPGAEPPTAVGLASGQEVVVVAPAQSSNRSPRPSAGHGSRPDDGSWSAHAARALGAPTLPAALTVSQQAGSAGSARRLGALAKATAGFRDEYYGLVGACREWKGEAGGEPNRLVTVGSVEPLALRWGLEPIRFGGRRWTRPTIDVEAVDGKVRAWTDRQLRPKVVLATQSKLLEPVVDRAGTLVPATPLIVVHAEPDDLDLVAAVLLAPPVVAWAWQRWFGAALAVDALKLAARQVGELPLPPDRLAWRAAGSLIAESSVATVEDGLAVSRSVAAIMNRAYGADDAVLHWWLRRTGRRGAAAVPAGKHCVADHHAR